MTSYDPNLVKLIRTIVNSTLDESKRNTRIPGTLSGTVEDIDDDLDILFIRMDQEAMQSDPTVSDNYDAPGIIPTTRLGETYVNEQVRVNFDVAGAANAMRTGSENKIILPYGREEGMRIILDGNTGAIGFFDEDDQLVGYLDALQWFVGAETIGRVRIDPIGGVRLWDENSEVRALLSAEEGLQVREAVSGITGVVVRHDGIIVTDPATGETISITSGDRSSMPAPHWASSEQQNPTATHSTPAISSFGSGDDLDLRFVAASAASALGTQSYTPPSGYTEQADVVSSGSITLQASLATKDPSDASPGVANFTSSSSSFTRRTGHTVIVRGGGPTSPAVGSVEVGTIQSFSGATIPLTINVPSGVAAGDLLVVHVAIASSAVPIGWTVPPGWVQLGVQAAGVGTTHILGSGIWYKRVATGDPTSENLLINMSTAANSRVHATVARVTNPYTFPAGLDIRRNNRSMPRGLVAEVASTTSTGAIANSSMPATVDSLTNIPLLAGRSYRIAYNVPLGTFSPLHAADTCGISIEIDEGSGFTSFVRTQRRNPAAGISKNEIGISRTYVPASDMTLSVRTRLRADAVTTGFTMTLEGATDHRRSLTIEDVGAVY